MSDKDQGPPTRRRLQVLVSGRHVEALDAEARLLDRDRSWVVRHLIDGLAEKHAGVTAAAARPPDQSAPMTPVDPRLRSAPAAGRPVRSEYGDQPNADLRYRNAVKAWEARQ